jgi:hypothetical protein
MIGAVTVLRTVREEYDAPRAARIIEWVAIPIYGLVTVVALVPELLANLGSSLQPLQIEGLILTILIILGVQLAWILMVEPTRESIP